MKLDGLRKLLRGRRNFWATLSTGKGEGNGSMPATAHDSAAVSETGRRAREEETVEALERRGEEWYGAMLAASGLERGKRYVEAFLCLIDASFLAERTGRAEEAARLQARISGVREEFLSGFASPELGEMAELEARGEKAYSDMYEAYGATAEAGCYDDLKDYFARAIGLAERAGLTEEAQRLEARLKHMQGVYRSQFS